MSTNKGKMNVFQLTVLTCINMIGSGIIMLPSNLAKVGTISILSWIVTAGGSLALAYTFSQLGMLSRKPGGMGGYAEYSFGKSGSFLTNYTYGLSLAIANVGIATSAVGYGTVCLGIKLSPLGVGLATIAILWLTSILNFGGSRITGKIGSVTIWGIIIPLLFLCVFGWFWFDKATFVSAWNPHNLPFGSAVGQSISLTLWAFLGFESAAANMDAVENPRKNVPIAVLSGTIGAAIIYILSTNVIAGIIPNSKLLQSDAPFGLAFASIFNPTVGRIVMILMFVACFGSLLGWQFTIAQVFKSSAVDGFFPKIFTKVTKTDTPIVGMIILGIIQTLLGLCTISPSLSKQFSVLVNLAVVTNVVPYLLSMGSLNVMQKIENVPHKKMTINNVITLIAAAYSLYALYSCGFETMTYGSLVTFAGWIIYSYLSPKFDAAKEMKINSNDLVLQEAAITSAHDDGK